MQVIATVNQRASIFVIKFSHIATTKTEIKFMYSLMYVAIVTKLAAVFNVTIASYS